MATNKWAKGDLRSSSPAGRRERGQAMVFFVLTVLACLLATIALFNVGQTVSEKMRVTNTADAAAYSGALWEARTLNFQAYTNRAIVANEVAIAQVVSFVSWTTYLKTFADNVATVTSWIPYVGEVTSYVADVAAYIAEFVEDGAGPMVQFLDSMVIKPLSLSQTVAHVAAYAAVPAIVQEVVKKNDPNAGVTMASAAFMASNLAAWTHLTKQYGGDDRQRLADVVMDSRDGFTRERNKHFFDLDLGLWKINIEKRGGTDLVKLDEWQAVDTHSIHIDEWSCSWDDGCGWEHQEIPVGYGAAEANQGTDQGDGYHGGSAQVNPAATRKALGQSSGWGAIWDMISIWFGGGGGDGSYKKTVEGFSGLPKYRDIANLDVTDASSRDPRISLTVEVKKDDAYIRTSTKAGVGASEIGDGGLELHDKFAGNEISKLAKAEVYFKHPDNLAYGAAFSRKEEYGNLFNPYWQVRLIPASDGEWGLATIAKIH